MKINNVNISNLNKPNKDAPVKKAEVEKEASDSIKISSEAREILNQEKAARINEIKDRLSKNFYNRKEILEKTAEAILKELN